MRFKDMISGNGLGARSEYRAPADWQRGATLRIITADPECGEARACLSAYYGELAAIFPGGFDVSLSRDPDVALMRAPQGCFLLAFEADRAIACVGLKGGGKCAEVKRLWIAPAARGLGLARLLMERLETEARTLGIPLLRLDTNRALPAAIAMYRRFGWIEIERFNDDPYAQVFFEKRLSP